MKRIIVSAADQAYYPFLDELISSIEDARADEDVAIGVLDVGLTPEQHATLDTRVTHVVSPGWDYEFAGRSSQPQYLRAMTARPHLPKYFPGYDVIMWMDADTWIQHWMAVGHFFAQANAKDLAICQELDRSYANIYYLNNSRKLFHKTLNAYGNDISQHVGAMPMLNSGVFAMHRDCHYWEKWVATLDWSLRAGPLGHLSEQTALNVCVYRELPLPAFLPAKFNWCCIHACPIFDAEHGKYVEPSAPYDEIAIVHHTGMGTRNAPAFKVMDLRGNATAMNLRYSQWKACRNG